MDEIKTDTVVSPPPASLLDGYAKVTFAADGAPWNRLGTKVPRAEFMARCRTRNILTTLLLHGSFPVAAAPLDARVPSTGAVLACKATPDQIGQHMRRLDATLFKVSNGMANVRRALVARAPLQVDAQGTLRMGSLTFKYDMVKQFGAPEQRVCFQTLRDALPSGLLPMRQMVFIPPVNAPWAGISSVGTSISSATTSYIKAVADIDVVTHEFGHALGLSHSCFGGNEYGDRWCVMGSDGDVRKNVTSLNAAQTYYAGWMRKVTFADARTEFRGALEQGMDACVVVAIPIVPAAETSEHGAFYADPLPFPLLVLALRGDVLTAHSYSHSGFQFARTVLQQRQTLVSGAATEFVVSIAAKTAAPVWMAGGTDMTPGVGDFLELPSALKVSVGRSADGRVGADVTVMPVR